jgi:hypothetical protein
MIKKPVARREFADLIARQHTIHSTTFDPFRSSCWTEIGAEHQHRRWGGTNGVQSSSPNAEIPREGVGKRWSPSVATREAVIELLSSPEAPATEHGPPPVRRVRGWCERRFVVSFDKHGASRRQACSDQFAPATTSLIEQTYLARLRHTNESVIATFGKVAGWRQHDVGAAVGDLQPIVVVVEK